MAEGSAPRITCARCSSAQIGGSSGPVPRRQRPRPPARPAAANPGPSPSRRPAPRTRPRPRRARSRSVPGGPWTSAPEPGRRRRSRVQSTRVPGPSRSRSPAARSSGSVTTAMRCGQGPVRHRRRLAQGRLVGLAQQQQVQQFGAPPVHRAGAFGLLEGVGLGAHRRQLVDVGEDRFAQVHHDALAQLVFHRDPGHLPERHAGAHPVGAQQRVHAPALPELAAAQPGHQLPAFLGQRRQPGPGQLQEAVQRRGHAPPQAAAEAPLDGPGVRRNQLRDGVDDGLHDAGHPGPQHVADLPRQRQPGRIVRGGGGGGLPGRRAFMEQSKELFREIVSVSRSYALGEEVWRNLTYA